MFMQDTYWRNKLIRHSNKRRKKTSLTKYLPLTLLQGFEKVMWGFTVRGSWRPKITEIFWPQSYGRQRCVFLVLQGCSTGALESTLLGAGFPYYNSSISVSNSTQLSLFFFNSSALYNFQIPTRWYGHASTPPQFLPISGDWDVSLPLSLNNKSNPIEWYHSGPE